MSDRWLTLINNLTQLLLEEPALMDDPGRLVEEFTGEGYGAREVETAVAWISRFIAEPAFASPWSLEPFTSNGFRTRSLEEQLSFSPEAFGFLLRLENSGIIDPAQREEILERALGTYDDEIGEEEIKTVSRMVLQDHGVPLPSDGGDLWDLTEGSRSRGLN